MATSILIWKNDEQLGPYSEDEIRQRLQNGTFSPDDLAWTEGQADWVPLSSILPEAATPLPLPQTEDRLFESERIKMNTQPPPLPSRKKKNVPLRMLVRIIVSIVLLFIIYRIGRMGSNKDFGATYNDPSSQVSDATPSTQEQSAEATSAQDSNAQPEENVSAEELQVAQGQQETPEEGEAYSERAVRAQLSNPQ